MQMHLLYICVCVCANGMNVQNTIARIEVYK